MKKLTLLLFFTIITHSTCSAQSKFVDSSNTKEYNFFYKDSIDGKVSYGKYEPTGFVSLKDGSLIVSTQFSIDFPGEFDFENKSYNEIRKKSHNSSGSVFKLNNAFEKKWEIIFKDHRVMKIGKLQDESLIVAGERIDMKKFWMANIDTSGKILWQNEYQLEPTIRIDDMTIDHFGNTLLVIRSEHIIPVLVNRHFGKIRIEFFKETFEEGYIFIIKVSSTGKILWRRYLDKRKHFTKFGEEIFLDQNIYVKTHYDGFIKKKNKWVEMKGRTVFEVNPKGKIINKSESQNNFLYHFNEAFYSCTPREDTLNLYTYVDNKYKPIDSVILKKPIKSVWIENALTTENNIYLFGSNDHNLGYFVVKLDSNNKYVSHWNDTKTEACELVDGIVKPDGTIIILGRVSKEGMGSRGESVSYINFTFIRDKGMYIQK